MGSRLVSFYEEVYSREKLESKNSLDALLQVVSDRVARVHQAVATCVGVHGAVFVT
jgi:hypothetical protein